MIPSLARRGKLILATGGLYAALGAITGAAPLAVLGGLVLCALMSAYLVFFPTAIILRRRKFEMSWWVVRGDGDSAALFAGKDFLLRIALRNHSGRRLRVGALRVLCSSAMDVPEGLDAAVPGTFHVEISGLARARCAGQHMLHGAVLTFADILGLFELSAYFPNPLAVKALPQTPSNQSHNALRLVAAPRAERSGGHASRRRGIAGDVRELRQRQSGDPFKLIAWKATARTGRLMVRDMETEIVLTHQLMVDIGASMRRGEAGARKLDAAISLASAVARTAILAGDRAGLLTYDTKVCTAQAPASGNRAYLALRDRLTEAHHIVDEDLTDVTDGELCACVARYLAHQEAIDVRLRVAPALDSAEWEMIQTGPEGELYDLRLLGRAIRLLLSRRGVAIASGRDTDSLAANLRRFCAVRGIELPYRDNAPRGMRSRGLAAAIDRACERQGSGHRLVIVSDFERAGERPELVDGALARARLAGHRIVGIIPLARILASQGPGSSPKAPGHPWRGTGEESRTRSLVAEAFQADARESAAAARAFFARRGVAVAIAEPGASAAEIALQLGSRGRRAA